MHRRDLLPVELGVIVLIEQEELYDAGREARHATQLSGIDRVDDMDDLEGRDADNLPGKARVGHVAGVPAQNGFATVPYVVEIPRSVYNGSGTPIPGRPIPMLKGPGNRLWR